LTVPPAPQFGEVIASQASPHTLDFLSRRRSASAMALTAPGPTPDELGELLRLAARVPDHGKLNPWRFVVLEGEAKAAFTARLEAIAANRPNEPKAAAALGKMRNPPLAVAVISSPIEGKIPLWEQQLSAGAVCNTLLIAATAMGYGANWITDWYAFDAEALEVLGVKTGEQIAGFLYLGSFAERPQERERPDVQTIVSRWSPVAGA
jgi:nitroreductase